MAGRWQEITSAGIKECTPVLYMRDLRPDQQRLLNDTSTYLTPEQANTTIAVPCGLVAKTEFNDIFQLWAHSNETGKVDFNNASLKVDISEDKIAWYSDTQYKFNNLKKESMPADK